MVQHVIDVMIVGKKTNNTNVYATIDPTEDDHSTRKRYFTHNILSKTLEGILVKNIRNSSFYDTSKMSQVLYLSILNRKLITM